MSFPEAHYQPRQSTVSRLCGYIPSSLLSRAPLIANGQLVDALLASGLRTPVLETHHQVNISFRGSRVQLLMVEQKYKMLRSSANDHQTATVISPSNVYRKKRKRVIQVADQEIANQLPTTQTVSMEKRYPVVPRTDFTNLVLVLCVPMLQSFTIMIKPIKQSEVHSCIIVFRTNN